MGRIVKNIIITISIAGHHFQNTAGYETVQQEQCKYDTIGEFNMDSKAEYSA